MFLPKAFLVDLFFFLFRFFIFKDLTWGGMFSHVNAFSTDKGTFSYFLKPAFTRMYRGGQMTQYWRLDDSPDTNVCHLCGSGRGWGWGQGTVPFIFLLMWEVSVFLRSSCSSFLLSTQWRKCCIKNLQYGSQRRVFRKATSYCLSVIFYFSLFFQVPTNFSVEILGCVHTHTHTRDTYMHTYTTPSMLRDPCMYHAVLT